VKILTVTNHFAGSVDRLFRKHGGITVLRDGYLEDSYDLVVFTGGEDVHPRYYDASWQEHYPEAGWYDPSRDALEMKVMKEILQGKLKTKKVLGICRGHQLINVALGGSLIYDIRTSYGVGHGGWHPLSWKTSNVFEGVFDEVNSMHHQGLASIGERISYTRIATEPKTEISEIVLWGDKFLGFQFHPEAMQATGERGADIIAQWITGEVSILKRVEGKAQEMTARKNLFSSPKKKSKLTVAEARELMELNNSLREAEPNPSIRFSTGVEGGTAIVGSSWQFTPSITRSDFDDENS
jgi:putative glutamine amidotransferase